MVVLKACIPYTHNWGLICVCSQKRLTGMHAQVLVSWALIHIQCFKVEVARTKIPVNYSQHLVDIVHLIGGWCFEWTQTFTGKIHSFSMFFPPDQVTQKKETTHWWIFHVLISPSLWYPATPWKNTCPRGQSGRLQFSIREIRRF